MQKISKIFLIKNILILCLLAACAEAASNWKKKQTYTAQYDTSDAKVEKGLISQYIHEKNHDGGPVFGERRQLDHSNIFWAKMLSPTHVMTIYLQNRNFKERGNGRRTNDLKKHSLIVHHWKINLDDDKEKFSVASWFSMESDLLHREPVWGNRNTLSCVQSRCGQVLTFLPEEMHVKYGSWNKDMAFYEPIHKNPGDAAIFIFTSDVGTKDYQVSDTMNKDDFGYQKDKTTPHRDLFKPTSNYPGKGWMRSASIVAMSGLGMATDHKTKDKKESASFFVTFNEWIAPADMAADDFKNTPSHQDVLPMDRWSIFIQEKEYDSELQGGFGYTKAVLRTSAAFFKIDGSGYCATYDMKKHDGHVASGRGDAAADMMNHEHVFTVNNPEVHKTEFFMTFVMMASESKDNKFVINPKGKHYLVIASLNISYHPNVGLRLFTGDLNAKNQVYPFFDKEGTTLNPRRAYKIPYHASYHVTMRQKGEALIVEDGLFEFWDTDQNYFRYVNVHNIDITKPDNGFKEITMPTAWKDTAHERLISIRQCGDSRWVASRYQSNGTTYYKLYQNWADITEGSHIQQYANGHTLADYPQVCGPNTWINFFTIYNKTHQHFMISVGNLFYYDENYVDTTSLTPAGVCDAYIEKIRAGKKACQQINHKGEFYSGSAHIYYMNENKFKIDIFQQTQEQLSAAFQHMRKKNDWTCGERNDVMCKTIRLHDDAHKSTGTSKAIKDAEFFATVTWDITQRAGGSDMMDWQKKVQGWKYHGKIGILMCLMTDLDQFAPDVNFKFDKRTGREKHHFSHRTYYAMLPSAEAYMTLPDKSNLNSSTFKDDKSTSSCKPPKIPFYWFYGIDCKYTPPPPVEVATMTLPPCGLAYKVAMGFEKLNSGAFETTALNERTLLDEGQSTKSKAGELEKCFMSIKGKFTHTIKCFLHKFNATWNDKYKKTDKGEDTKELNPNYNPQFLEDGSENPKYWKGFPGFLKDEFQTAAKDNGFVMWEGSDDKHKAAVEAKMGTELYEKMKADIDKFAKETKWAAGFSQQLVNKSKDLVAKQDEETKVETA